VSSWGQCCLFFVLTPSLSLGASDTISQVYPSPDNGSATFGHRFDSCPLYYFSSFCHSVPPSFPRTSSILFIDLLKPRVLFSHFPLLICTLCHMAPRLHFVIVSFIVYAVDPSLFPSVWFLDVTANTVDVASTDLYNVLFRKRDLWMPTLPGMPVWSYTVAAFVSLHTTTICKASSVVTHCTPVVQWDISVPVASNQYRPIRLQSKHQDCTLNFGPFP